MQTECFPDAVAHWPKAPVSNLAEVNPRYSVKKGLSYPFIEMASVGENFTGIITLDMRKLEGSGLSRFKAGDTLFAKITPCAENGKVAFVQSLPGNIGLGSTEFIVLSPRPDVHARFLFHLACSHDVRGRAVARMEGSTGRQRVPDEVFEKRLLVPIPLPEEQAAIARILDAVDSAVERTRAAVERAANVKQALAQRLFQEGVRGEAQEKTAIGLLPKSWNAVPVNSVVTAAQYGLSVPMQDKGAMPVLRMVNIQGGAVLLEQLKYVTLPDKLIAPYIVKRGDVLFNRTNSQEHVGKVGIYRYDTPIVFASYLIRLCANTTKVDNYYLGHVLNSYSSQCRIKRYATPGVQQVNINATNLGKVLIPLPAGKHGLDEQREIASILESADAVVRSYEPVLGAQRALKASLMYDLLTGRVRVTELEKALEP